MKPEQPLTPLRARRSSGKLMTQARYDTFLDGLRAHGCVSAAAESAGLSRTAVYAHRAAHPGFAEQWGDALEQAADSLEMEARRRAVDGVEEAVFHQGLQCGTVRRYSDRLLEVLLRGSREKFRTNRQELANPPGESLKVEQMTTIELARRVEFLLASAKRAGEVHD